MERLKITINFKHTEEEEALYNELIKYSSPGAYIKDVLLFKISRNKEIVPKRKKNDDNSELNLSLNSKEVYICSD